jgi:hypothetical protein
MPDVARSRISVAKLGIVRTRARKQACDSIARVQQSLIELAPDRALVIADQPEKAQTNNMVPQKSPSIVDSNITA